MIGNTSRKDSGQDRMVPNFLYRFLMLSDRECAELKGVCFGKPAFISMDVVVGGT